MAKNVIFLGVNPDENIIKVLKKSNKYFECHNVLVSRINDMLWIFSSLEDLMPQTVEKFGSGHMFPILEANTELESSIQLCKLGFYKHAFIALRNALELGLLSVYWDIDDKSHVNIQKWLYSFEYTPFRKKTVAPKLKTNPNIKKFDGKHGIFVEIDKLFGELSDFVHTKGRHHSSIDLGNANFNQFNEKSLLTWIGFMNRVIKYIAAIHVLKYPIALQYTPIEQKFGLNLPAGYFLEPHQSEKLKQFFKEDDDKFSKDLQEISDNDPEAQSLREGILQRPDISQEKLQQQSDEFWKSHT